MYETKCGNQTVYSLPHSPPLAPKQSEVLCGFHSDILAACVEDLEPAKFAKHERGRAFSVNSLEYLTQDQIRQAKPFSLPNMRSR